METTQISKFFAEVIQSSLQQWKSQSWKWHTRPDFASLMVIENKTHTTFGLVYNIETGSGQTDRTPFPYQKTEEELLKEQPHIFELLQTHFMCLTVGYKEPEKQLIYQYTPHPPKIHDFVRHATHEEYELFFADNRYLAMLFASANESFNLDELLLALLRVRMQQNLLTKEQLRAFIESFSLLTGNDYRRLKLFVHRVQPIISNLYITLP